MVSASLDQTVRVWDISGLREKNSRGNGGGNMGPPGMNGTQSQGADMFFGEPALEIDDFVSLDGQGRGVINVLAADRLMRSPKLYATFLLWLLAELFESLPEVGDPEKPKLVFFFDEAHLLFESQSHDK